VSYFEGENEHEQSLKKKLLKEGIHKSMPCFIQKNAFDQLNLFGK
jgi:hypothetical protein